ncbi:MAG: hypothetical protein EG825_15940 [Rhodocyclaceae bacterium]|nr:hypothetical protein [Rhodocyclaceae bacterium]
MGTPAEQETRGGCRCHPLVFGVLLLALVLAQAAQSWSAWKGRSVPVLDPGPIGGWYGVTLAGGAVYYGRLLEAGPGQVKLADVYYVETFIADPSGRRDNRLVNRQKNDWHSPETMVIAADKILMIETVGTQSRLAKLIEQERALPAPK